MSNLKLYKTINAFEKISIQQKKNRQLFLVNNNKLLILFF